MERNYYQEMQNTKESVLKEIRAILEKSENSMHTFKSPFYIHFTDVEVAATEVCYYVKKSMICDAIIIGTGDFDSGQVEDKHLIRKDTGYTTESLIHILHLLEEEETKEMTVRIVFTSEVYITGKSLGEIKEKFDGLPIFSADALEQASAEFVDIVSVEDESHKELLEKYDNA